MIGILFYFEEENKSVYSGNDNGFHLWRESAKCLSCDWYGMIDLTQSKVGQKFKNLDEEVGYGYYLSLFEAINANPNMNFIFLETPETLNSLAVAYTHLNEFVHPQQNVIYVVGPDSIGFLNSDKISSNLINWVSIPAMRYSLWSFTAAIICLYDRFQKMKL